MASVDDYCKEADDDTKPRAYKRRRTDDDDPASLLEAEDSNTSRDGFGKICFRFV